ncbi:alpha/beta hydrolase [Cohnella endophytica]|uniref:Alpha/beta hydrolase n=1 Tax=Cohnella endophytica TaxID=2419778 RepID=A0A494XGF7_9BACL|nr:alpha/beta fold hydrolase [Cohnella endophytica]RKP48791.1 alpha/beta hydrolase [Cohnella endophytica]
MTTMTTPLPLAGSGNAMPAPVLPSSRRGIRRLLRTALQLFYTLIALSSIIFVALHAYLAWTLSHPPVATFGSNPMLAKSLPYSDVTFPSADNKTQVDGWWIPSTASRSTVVLSHGYGANREELWVPMYDLAERLHNENYNVLMFDYGFASTKHSTPATGGIIESQQLIGAIQYARGQGSDELIVWGFSMGAGTALQAALLGVPVDAMILDSTFIPDSDTIYGNILNWVHIPKYPSLTLVELFFPLMSGVRLEQIPSTRIQDTAYDFPLLLIHGTADDKAPTSISEHIAKSQKNALSQLWVVPGAIHEMIYRTHTAEYVQRTDSFLKQVHAGALAKAHSSDTAQASNSA